MPTIARSDDKKPTTQTQADPKKMVKVAAETASDLTRAAVDTTSALIEQSSVKLATVAETKRPELASPPATAHASDINPAAFWLDLVKAQTAHNLDALHKIMTARTAQERLGVQSAYISGNLARMVETASRCMQLVGVTAAFRLPTSTRAPGKSR